jgi:hypothetical protein
MGHNGALVHVATVCRGVQEWVELLLWIRPGWLAGLVHEEELVFLFPERIFYSTQKSKEIWGKYLETLENYEKFPGGRLGYLA